MAKRNLIAKYYLKHPQEEGVVFLNVYQNKQGLRGTIADKRNVRISSAMFYEKDKDNTIYRVMEYYGFTNENSVKIK